jgi:hypothetical protein
MSHRFAGRLMRTAAVVAAVALAAGCNDFLKASNPSAIQADDLTNPAYATLMVNGVIGEFQQAYDDDALYSGVFSDEVYNTFSFPENREIDKRNIDLGNGTYPLVLYVPMHRARFLADSVASRLKVFDGDSATRDLRVARALLYAGYSYQLLAEQLCTIPINGSVPYSPEELTTKFTVPRFTEAVAIARAAKANTVNTATQAAADSVTNAALVGAARASLYVNDKAAARTYAAQVPAAFEFRAYYSAQNPREFNQFFTDAQSSPIISMEPKNKRLNDPRVPHPTTPEGAATNLQGNLDTVVVNGVPRIGYFLPNSPLMFSTYSGTTTGADFTRDGFIRFATGLEAQYVVAEADGPTAATVAFVNSRRAVGGQGNYGGTDIMAELREQRRRDFFLDGHRLGDMRRYLKYLQIDEFPRGKYPPNAPPSGETYNDATCFPLPLSELAGNPNASQ